MSDSAVMKTLASLAKQTSLTQDDTNNALMGLFPDLDFLDEGESTNVVIRRFTPWYMTNKVKSKNLTSVLKSLDLIYPKLYLNHNTLDNYFSTDIRKPIAKRFGNKSEEHKLSLELTALTWDQKGEVIKKAKEKVTEKNSYRTIFSGNRVLKLIKDNITSTDVLRKAVALLLASGARPNEMFGKGVFTPIEDHPHWIKQVYIAKRRGEEGEPVIKPIIYLTAKEFIEEVQIMREGLAKRYKHIIVEKTGQVSSSVSTAANDMAKVIFEHQEKMTLYKSKDLYGSLSYDIYGKVSGPLGDNHSLSMWLQKLFGHASSGTVNNYSGYAIEHDVIPNEVVLARQEVIEAQIDDLKERLEEKKIPEADPEPDDPIPVDGDIFKNPKLEAILVKLKVIYDSWKSQHPKSKLTLTIFEELTRGKAVRRIIRLAFNRFKEVKA